MLICCYPALFVKGETHCNIWLFLCTYITLCRLRTLGLTMVPSLLATCLPTGEPAQDFGQMDEWQSCPGVGSTPWGGDSTQPALHRTHGGPLQPANLQVSRLEFILELMNVRQIGDLADTFTNATIDILFCCSRFFVILAHFLVDEIYICYVFWPIWYHVITIGTKELLWRTFILAPT